MKMTMKKMMTMIVMLVGTFAATASPLALPAKIAAREAVEKIGARAGAEVGGRALVRGGAALATVTAEREAAKAVSRTTTAAALNNVSPKQILAAGAATALVVGVHEVADGAQTVCEGSAEAIRENPDLAPSVMDRIFKPITAISVLACGAALAILMWFFWPFLALARNGIRLAAVRRAGKSKLGLTAAENSPEPSEAQAGYVRVGMLHWLVGGFTLLTVLGIWRAVDSGGYVWIVNPERAKRVAGICAKYDEAVKRHLDAFRADVDATATEQFSHVRRNVPHVAAQFGTMSKCGALVKTIVLDKLKGGNRTEDEIKKGLEADYYRGLYAARDAVAGCLGRLKDNLELESRTFRAELGKELASEEQLGDREYRKLLETCGERIEVAKHELSSAQIDAGISVAIEAICIRQTVSIVARILGKAAARQAGTMAAGAGAAVADGPLPIGDIIGGIAVVGCTAWTTWDVYKATKILPEKLVHTLYGAVDDCERQCREEVLTRGGELASKFSTR